MRRFPVVLMITMLGMALSSMAASGGDSGKSAASKSKTTMRKVMVGNPQNPDALPREIQDAYDNGSRMIVIHPGVYLLPKLGHTVCTLQGWTDATLSAYGCTMILQDTDGGHDAFDLRDCTHVTLRGPTLSQNVVTFYQGRVVEVGQDAKGKAWCDWKPDTGYPVPPANATQFPGGANIVDKKTRMLKIGNGDFWSPPMESIGNGVYRLHFNQPNLA